MPPIRIGIVGVGNCALALLDSIDCAARGPLSGIRRSIICEYSISDIIPVLALDIDDRKVGKPLSEAAMQSPNCAWRASSALRVGSSVTVLRGPTMDGIAPHTRAAPASSRIVESDRPALTSAEIVDALRETRCDVMVNYLPVGSSAATTFYVECALRAGTGIVNCIPVFVASDPQWAVRCTRAGVPVIGDDVKSQVGATILHRAIVEMFAARGAIVDRTYQLNVGGNTDFFNMLDRERLTSKRESKTSSVQAVTSAPLDAHDIHIGPSDYVAQLGDTKVCFIRVEGRVLGGAPVTIDIRLQVEDSANSAGVVIDAIRYCKVALDRKLAGPILGPSALLMKHPPNQATDHEAQRWTDRFESGVSQENS